MSSLNANILVSVNFSYFNVSHYHSHAGYVSYRVCIYEKNPFNENTKEKKYAKVIRFQQKSMDYQPQLKEHNLISLRSCSQPCLSKDELYFCSRWTEVNQVNRDFVQNYSCQWEIQVDIQQIDRTQFFIEVELRFRQKSPFTQRQDKKWETNLQNQNIDTISTFKGRINKAYNVFSFLPITFDQLETIRLNATYLSVVKSFSFIPSYKIPDIQNDFLRNIHKVAQKMFRNKQITTDRNKTSMILENEQQSYFYQYLDRITQKFLSRKIKQFYLHYRHQLIEAQNWLNQLIQELNVKIKGSSKNKDLIEKNIVLTEENQSISPIQSQAFTQQFSLMYKQHQNLNQFQQSTKKIANIIKKDLLLQEFTIFHLFSNINKLILLNSIQITQQKSQRYKQILQQRYKNNIFSHQIVHQKDNNIGDFTFSKYDDSGQHNIKWTQIEKRKNHQQNGVWKVLFQIQDTQLLNHHNNYKIFQEIYSLKNLSLNSSTLKDLKKQKKLGQKINRSQKKLTSQSIEKSIVFLVHGFGASKIDLMLLKKALQINFKAQIFISLQNMSKTEDSIEIQGERLAEQVKRYLLNEKSINFKLSFIGHSLGGLVIRSALSYLQQYKQHFYSYISICTPHLGYLYSPCWLTQIGLWFISKIEDCTSLRQLTLRDITSDLKNSFIYKLSKNGSLDHFKHVAFLASSQDTYVPYQSSRLEKSEKLLSQMKLNDQNQKAMVIEQIVDNVLNGIKSAEHISRINVIFHLQEKFSLKALTGRPGHVRFLQDEQFLKQFVICFRRFFQ